MKEIQLGIPIGKYNLIGTHVRAVLVDWEREISFPVERSTVELVQKLINGEIRKSGIFTNDWVNREKLPFSLDDEYYTKYYLSTPEFIGGHGPERLVVGKGGEIYYTANHYISFIRLTTNAGLPEGNSILGTERREILRRILLRQDQELQERKKRLVAKEKARQAANLEPNPTEREEVQFWYRLGKKVRAFLKSWF